MNKGKIVQVIGPVVDVEFPAQLPALFNALKIEFTPPGGALTKLTLEVQQHLGDNWVRAIAMSSTEGLRRGQEVTDNGKPISMPVGEAVMGLPCSTSPATPWTNRARSRPTSSTPFTARPRRSWINPPRRRCSPPASRSSISSARS